MAQVEFIDYRFPEVQQQQNRVKVQVKAKFPAHTTVIQEHVTLLKWINRYCTGKTW